MAGLGSLYATGRGVPLDNVLAHMWFSLAAAAGDADAARRRDVVAVQMTPDQLATAQKLAHQWQPTDPGAKR
jgi:TPR repeat protein